MMKSLAAVAILLAGIPAAAFSSAAGDAAKGAQLARQWCAHCHIIGQAPAPSTVQQGPPAFTAIGMTGDQIRAFLTRPHGAMPDLALTRTEIDDVIAYIESLR